MKPRTMKKNEILDLSFDFALEIIKLVKYLKANKEFVMSSQLLRKRLEKPNIG